MTTRQALDQGSCLVVRWTHPRFRIYAIRARNLVFEAAPFEGLRLTPPQIGHQVTCVLRGELVSRRGDTERSAGPGVALVEPSMIWNERWMGAAFDALLIDWDPLLAPLATTEVLPLGLGGAQRVATLFDRILEGDDDEDTARTVFAGACELLGHLGLGRLDSRVEPRWFEGSPADRATARWVSALRCDVENANFKRAMHMTGLGERQLRRQYTQMAAHAGMPSNLRTVLVCDRLAAAVRLLSVSAPIEQVAMASGFGSSRALGLALDHASMPTATEIRRLARQR